ncbi:hypothetical protein Z043_117733, partial [Scleropages formosus]
SCLFLPLQVFRDFLDSQVLQGLAPQAHLVSPVFLGTEGREVMRDSQEYLCLDCRGETGSLGLRAPRGPQGCQEHHLEMGSAFGGRQGFQAFGESKDFQETEGSRVHAVEGRCS